MVPTDNEKVTELASGEGQAVLQRHFWSVSEVYAFIDEGGSYTLALHQSCYVDSFTDPPLDDQDPRTKPGR